MNGAFYIGAVGLEAQQRALDGIANNISNVNTPAFKRSDIRFSEIVASRNDMNVVGPALDMDAPVPGGVLASPMFMVNQAGAIEKTGNRSDIAIDGEGFIEIMGPGGQTLLWRGGSLKVGDDGLLCTAQGLPLKAAISVPSDTSWIEISSDGTVRAISGEGVDPVEIGQLTLVKVTDPSILDRLDGGLYRPNDSVSLQDARPGEDGVGLIVQGALEQSNVELTSEMVQLMMVQRAYAANAQIVQAADQLAAIANGLRR
jgi:flagellar basal-body rod protein FlgG